MTIITACHSGLPHKTYYEIETQYCGTECQYPVQMKGETNKVTKLNYTYYALQLEKKMDFQSRNKNVHKESIIN